MNKRAFTKQIMAVALSLIMILGLMPMTAFADGTYTFPSNSQSGNNNSTLRYYLTDENAGDVTISEESGHVQLRLALDDGWYFDKWETYFNGYEDVASLSDPEVKGSNPVTDEGYYTFFNTNGQKSAFVNHSGSSNVWINISKSTDFYGDHSVTAVLKPIVTVNADWGVTYVLTTQNQTAVSSNQTAVKYKDDVTITYTVDGKYVLTAVNASGTKNIEIDKTNSKVVLHGTEKPTSVGIHARLKQQNVDFDANGGKGTMSAQMFEHSVEQTLAANSFTKVGYTFAGWNTLANGDGIAYSDQQSVAFTPANDGDRITLYAQWTACTNHNWVSGKCTQCGILCSHSGGNATCTEKAACEICSERYGDLAKHNIVYRGSNNVITETCTAGCGHSATAAIEQDMTLPAVYTGSAIEPLKVSYSDGWQGGDLPITYANNTHVGTASGTIEKGEAAAIATFEITKATPDTPTAPTAENNILYGEKLDAVGLTSGWTWAEGNIVPTVQNDGYMAYYIPADTANYDWRSVEGWNGTTGRLERNVPVTVNKASLTVAAKDKTITYGEVPANDGVTYSGFVNGETEAVLGGTLDFHYNYTQYGDIGTYEIIPKGLTSENYEITYEKGEMTVAPKELVITWGNTAFVYDGTEKFPELAADGIITGDDVQLTFDGAATDASDAPYTAAITGIIGEDAANYKLPDNITKDFSIGKATPDLGTVSVRGVVTDTTKPEDVVLVCTNKTVNGTLKVVKVGSEFMQANKSLYDWEFVPADLKNYNVVYGDVQIDVLDTAVPNVSIKIDTNEWKDFLNAVTFDLLFKDSQEVTIIYADNENGSGLKDALYYVADRKLDESELKVVEWTSYTETFSIERDGKYVIYAKATDNDGNIIIVNSTGIVLDETAAAVNGITNGGIYYGQVVFTAKDELAGTKTVEIDGVDVTPVEGQYVIDPDNAEHTITVTDHAGNVTEYKITVYKNYTVTFMANGEILSTETVGYGKDAALPAVPAKDGYTGQWSHNGKNITADTEIKAVYTAKAITVPSDGVQSPQTGDNSNMALWFAILFISGGALVTLGVGKRRKNI